MLICSFSLTASEAVKQEPPVRVRNSIVGWRGEAQRRKIPKRNVGIWVGEVGELECFGLAHSQTLLQKRREAFGRKKIFQEFDASRERRDRSPVTVRWWGDKIRKHNGSHTLTK